MKKQLLLGAVTLLLTGCARHAPPTHLPSTALAPLVGKTGPDDLYPIPAITPGVSNPQVTQANIQQTICVAGWTATIRPPAQYTDQLKRKGIQEYGFSDPKPKDYEEDHFIPLELGGNPKDPGNLWPEPYYTQVHGKQIGAHEKDKVENLLRRQVCDGKITLQQAQEQMQTDWYRVYLANF
jgi:hypothetical protein